MLEEMFKINRIAKRFEWDRQSFYLKRWYKLNNPGTYTAAEENKYILYSIRYYVLLAIDNFIIRGYNGSYLTKCSAVSSCVWQSLQALLFTIASYLYKLLLAPFVDNDWLRTQFFC